MENPEEVLQALDEFQKMRPSEIPRELEEYLCWVAKTGDPVYQWSLVKPLFREKLTRVMTDFYESCPSLELASCPNVEQFNYDMMKCALLELFDSFANAPFTVQRICELLTSPRKEYNRVDKFMRAIEKNILVVSTREPGPAARRSENGDGMVNGSMDDDALSSQSTHEVEMESWVKDCTTEPTVAVSAEESSTPLLDSVITGKAPKIVATNDESSPVLDDKSVLPASRADTAAVTTDSQEISSTPNLALPIVAPETATCDTSVENSSGNGTDPVIAVADVPEAVINEDTSSQPSLDSEADDSESGASRKLQTTFQSKDFIKEAKSPKFYADEPKEVEKPSRTESEPVAPADPIAGTNSSDDPTEKSSADSKLSFECQETVLPIVESVLEKRPRSEIENADPDTGENPHSDVEAGSPFKKACSVISEPSERSDEPVAFLASPIASKTEEETSKMDENTIESSAESSCSERLSGDDSKLETEDDESKDGPIECSDDSLPQTERVTEVSESTRPIIEEPSFEEASEEFTSKSPKQPTEQPEGGITIEEAMDDDTRVNKSIIPDPIPIVEEPKEPEPTLRDSESTTIITELPDDSKNLADATIETAVLNVITDATILEEPPVASMSEETPIVPETSDEDITDLRSSATEPEEKIEPAESMEVDGDEAMPVFQQDEPMEQEPGDLMKS